MASDARKRLETGTQLAGDVASSTRGGLPVISEGRHSRARQSVVMTSTTRPLAFLAALLAAALFVAACGSGDDVDAEAAETVTDSSSSTSSSSEPSQSSGGSTEFQIEVWADNWMAVYVDGELIGEDSVPITTERSFNSETFTFEASTPFTIAIEAKDFKETDSGLEYIGEGNQQMGDGGIIVQITDTSTGEVVAGSDGTWSALVVHRAPLNVECENSTDPDSECEFEITETPAGWTDAAFDVSAWPTATEWSEAAVSPKDGYGQIDWDPAAQLIWGTDLEVDNTVLLRTTIGA